MFITGNYKTDLGGSISSILQIMAKFNKASRTWNACGVYAFKMHDIRFVEERQEYCGKLFLSFRDVSYEELTEFIQPFFHVTPGVYNLEFTHTVNLPVIQKD